MPSYVSGLDLGQQRDYTALVTVERERIPDPLAGRVGQTVVRHDVRHIHRWPLGTSYPAIIEDLQTWFRASPLRESTLVVDATGVGVAVVDMLRQANLMCRLAPYTITCGFQEGDGTVPKKDIIFAVIAALQMRRLRFAEELPLLDAMEKEMENYRVKVTPDRNETFAAFRETDHDDLVFALALAVWYGEKHSGSGEYGTDFSDPLGSLPAGTFGDPLPRDLFQ